MIVLCSNHASCAFISAAKECGRLGWLMGPIHYKTPKPGIPFALDNDCFIHFTNGTEFSFKKWESMLIKVNESGFVPMWVLVPDSVGNRRETIDRWHEYSATASKFSWPLAFAVQDGMTKEDVPYTAEVVFVGGTTRWKWDTAKMWCDSFPRVHIGRVNGLERLWQCQEIGAESCDGSGFLREGFHGKRANGLKAWIHLKTNPQPELF